MRTLVVALALVVLVPLTALSRRSGAPPSSTGALITSTLREATCSQSSCHEGAGDNTGAGRVLIEAVDQYTPDQTLRITIRVEEAGRERFGFQVAIKAASDTADFYEHVGTMALDDSARTQIVGKHYATHTTDGTTDGEWTLQRTPDSTETRPVTIFAAGNAADNSSSPVGDHIYTANKTLTSIHATAMEFPAHEPSLIADLHTFPNPFREQATVTFTLEASASVHTALFDSQGRRVRQTVLGMRTSGMHQIMLHGQGLPPGLYLYEIRTPDTRQVRPVLRIR